MRSRHFRNQYRHIFCAGTVVLDILFVFILSISMYGCNSEPDTDAKSHTDLVRKMFENAWPEGITFKAVNSAEGVTVRYLSMAAAEFEYIYWATLYGRDPDAQLPVWSVVQGVTPEDCVNELRDFIMSHWKIYETNAERSSTAEDAEMWHLFLEKNNQVTASIVVYPRQSQAAKNAADALSNLCDKLPERSIGDGHISWQERSLQYDELFDRIRSLNNSHTNDGR